MSFATYSFIYFNDKLLNVPIKKNTKRNAQYQIPAVNFAPGHSSGICARTKKNLCVSLRPCDFARKKPDTHEPKKQLSEPCAPASRRASPRGRQVCVRPSPWYKLIDAHKPKNPFAFLCALAALRAKKPMCKSHSFITTSSRLNIAFATTVNAASSADASGAATSCRAASISAL